MRSRRPLALRAPRAPAHVLLGLPYASPTAPDRRAGRSATAATAVAFRFWFVECCGIRKNLLVLLFGCVAFVGCNKNTLNRVGVEEDLSALTGLRIQRA